MATTRPDSPSINATNPTHPAHHLLTRSHSPTTATALFTTKIVQKPLLLHASFPTSKQTDKRALRRHVRLRKKEYFFRKQKPRPLSAREKRELGVHALRKDRGEFRYEVYEGLNQLWNGYMLEVLGLDGADAGGGAGGTPGGSNNRGKTITAASHGSLLASADFHGAEVEVVRCRCEGRVGIRGIVVRDTKFTFVIVTKRDEVKTVPKKETVFRYEVRLAADRGDGEEDQDQDGRKKLVFELHGSQIEIRPADRAKKQFKWKKMDYL